MDRRTYYYNPNMDPDTFEVAIPYQVNSPSRAYSRWLPAMPEATPQSSGLSAARRSPMTRQACCLTEGMASDCCLNPDVADYSDDSNGGELPYHDPAPTPNSHGPSPPLSSPPPTRISSHHNSGLCPTCQVSEIPRLPSHIVGSVPHGINRPQERPSPVTSRSSVNDRVCSERRQAPQAGQAHREPVSMPWSESHVPPPPASVTDTCHTPSTQPLHLARSGTNPGISPRVIGLSRFDPMPGHSRNPSTDCRSDFLSDKGDASSAASSYERYRRVGSKDSTWTPFNVLISFKLEDHRWGWTPNETTEIR